MKRFPAILGLVVLSLVLVVPVRAGESGDRDDWYALYIGDAKAGWFHQVTRTVTEDAGTFFVSLQETEISLARLGQPVTIVQTQEMKEDAAGKVVSFRTSQAMGTQEQVVEGRLNADGKLEVVQMGVKQVVDYPEGALGPAAVERKMRGLEFTPGATLTATTFTAEAPGQLVTATMTVLEPVKKDLLGRVVLVHPVKMDNSLIPMPTTAFVNDARDLLALEVMIPGIGKITMLSTVEQVAKAESEPAEVFVTTLLSPDRAIPEPRKLRRAVYRLGKTDGDLETILEDAAQKVVGREDGTLDLEVSGAAYLQGETLRLPVERTEELARSLDANAYIESADPAIRAMAGEAVGEETDARAAAAKIEKYVREKISKKNLGVGFATAAEVAKTLEGDCTEHAVLCAALARAKGMPSRVATGLVYLPPGPGLGGKTGIFGYHMWTEVLVAKDVWLPIDAAIGTWDATHIALAKSDLSDVNPTLDLTLAMLELLGSLSIEVIEPAE